MAAPIVFPFTPNFEFYTSNPMGPWDYHLVSLKQWREGYKFMYKKLIVDPGVYSIRGKSEYPHIGAYPLQDLPPNVYWTIPDYPHDMKPKLSADECIQKTLENIDRWKHLSNTIVSVQSEFLNFDSFQINWLKFYPLGERLAIGNLCKATKSSFITKVLKFAFTHNPEKKWIHIFGLRRRGIEWILNQHLDFLVSCDSQKWRLTPFWRTCHEAHGKGEKAKLKDDSKLYEFLTREYLANMDSREKQTRLF